MLCFSRKALCASLALVLLSAPGLFAVNSQGTNNNNKPPPCPGAPAGATQGSLKYRLNFGSLPFEEGLSQGALLTVQTEPSPLIYTPQIFYYQHPLAMQVARKNISGSTWDIAVVGSDTWLWEFAVASGSSVGSPTGRSSGRHETIRLLDANLAPVNAGQGNAAPTYVRVDLPDNSQLLLDWATNQVVSYRAPSGRLVSLSSIPEVQALKIVTQDAILRQVKSPEGLVDLVQVADQIMELRVYPPSGVGTFDSVNNRYYVQGQPYRVVRFDNPTGDPTRYDQIRVTETWGTRTKVDLFTYNSSIKEWMLQQGNSALLRKEEKIEQPGPASNERTFVRTLKDQNSVVISTTKEVWRDFAWKEELVSKTNEPSTLNYTETINYYSTIGELGYTLPKSKTFPDGYWETYTYDANRRLVQTTSPWKDTVFADAATGPRKIVSNSYISLASGDTVVASDSRPRTVTESVVTTTGGSPVVVKRTYYVYQTDSTGVYTEIEEKAATATAAYGAAGNLRTTRVHHTTKSTESGYNPIFAGRLRYEDRPDGTRTTYFYFQNISSPGSFWVVHEVLATSIAPTGVDGLSTLTEKLYDVRGHLWRTNSFIRTGGAWQSVSSEERTTNDQGFHVATQGPGRQIYAASYDGKFKVSETSENGVTITYTYDALEKIDSQTKVGVPASGAYAAQPAIVTTYERELGGLDCGCDGEVTAFTTAGSLTQEQQTKKDAIGRPSYFKDSAGLVTSYTYSLGGRQSTRTNPDGGTVVELKHSDRRLASATGSGVVAEYYDYGVNSDGTTWTKISKLSANGDRWQKTTADHLGQTVKIEVPAYDGGVLTTTYAYNAKGQLVRERQRHFSGLTETTIIADRLTEYDALGNVSRTGFDVNANGTLDLASADRVTDLLNTFAFHESAWWRVVQTKVYPTLNSSTAVQVSETRERLSGLGATLAAETVEVDVDGNATRRKQQIDFAAKLLLRTTTYPGSATSAIAITRNGLLVSESTKSVAATLYGYDALGRRISEKLQRHTQASVTAFDPVTGQVVSVTDAAGNVTTYAYYSNGQAGAGKVKTITNALTHTRRYAYDLLGRVVHKWGTAEYPHAYAYTTHGELQTLATWRDTGSANLDQSTWPAPSGGDVTTWTYQASTGLLTRKQYADGKGTDYGYDKLNRLATRTWARLASGSPLVTAYGYHSATGEKISVNYTDNTPDVAVTYDRLGRLETVTDATGTRSFAYDATNLRLDTETLPSAFYGARVLKRDYQGATSGQIPGRAAGYQLGTTSDSDQDFAVSYGYDGFGRLNNVTSPAGAYVYSYSGNSDFLATLTGPVHQTLRTFEPNRDVVDAVENMVGTTTISKFDYTVNAVGHRTARAQSGTAFAQTSADVFGYNTKGEVTGAANATLSTRNQSFGYDQIGNLLTFTTTSGTTSYTANSLNQYTQVSGLGSQPSYDFDGNQTANGLGQAYVWDAENRLISVAPVFPANGDKKVLNTYDAQSRRVRRQVSTYTSGTWTLSTDEKFVYEGWNAIAVLGWNVSTSTFDLNKTFTWGKDLSGSLQGAGGVGGLLAVRDGTAIYHYTYDANGNVAQVLSNSGSIVAHYEYTSFGETFVASGPYAPANEYRFSAKPLDALSGLYYYGYRHYNPSTGRWISRDPIAESGGVNIYSSLANNPIDRIDYLGMVSSADSGECCGGARLGWGQACCTGPTGDPRNGTPYHTIDDACCPNGAIAVPESRKFFAAPCCRNNGIGQYFPYWRRSGYSSRESCVQYLSMTDGSGAYDNAPGRMLDSATTNAAITVATAGVGVAAPVLANPTTQGLVGLGGNVAQSGLNYPGLASGLSRAIAGQTCDELACASP